MTNMSNAMMDGINTVAGKDDRWLFIGALALLLVLGVAVIRYLAAQQRRYETKLEAIVDQQSARSEELAVCVANNTAALAVNSDVLRRAAAELDAARDERRKFAHG